MRNGVAFNRGPSLAVVERAAGPLQRVRLSEVAPGGGKRGAAAGAPTMTLEEQIDATRRAAEDATRQARTIAGTGGSPPQRLSVVRPVLTAAPAKPAAAEGRAPGREKAAAPDTTR